MDTLADIAAAVFDMAARVLAPAGTAPDAAAGAAGAAALGAPAVGAQGAAPVAEGAGVTEQRIRQAVPGLPVGNLTVAVLKSQLQMYGDALLAGADENSWQSRPRHACASSSFHTPSSRLHAPCAIQQQATVMVLLDRAMFVLDDKTRHKATNEHIFNKVAIKRDELLDAWRRFMDKPGDQGGFDPARRLSDEGFMA
jgi:hypothetical protein